MKDASREGTFIFRKGGEGREESGAGAPDRGGADPAAAGGDGPRLLADHHLPGKGGSTIRRCCWPTGWRWCSAPRWRSCTVWRRTRNRRTGNMTTGNKAAGGRRGAGAGPGPGPDPVRLSGGPAPAGPGDTGCDRGDGGPADPLCRPDGAAGPRKRSAERMKIYYKKKFWAGVGALLLGLALPGTCLFVGWERYDLKDAVLTVLMVLGGTQRHPPEPGPGDGPAGPGTRTGTSGTVQPLPGPGPGLSGPVRTEFRHAGRVPHRLRPDGPGGLYPDGPALHGAVHRGLDRPDRQRLLL